MRMVIARSTKVLEALEGKISLPVGRMGKEEYLGMIANLMESSPENVMVAVVFSSSEEEDFKVHGFIIAMNPVIGDYISVLQAWDEGDFLRSQLQDALELFCEAKGKNFIRQEIPWSKDGFVTKLNLPLRELCLVAEAKIGG